MVKSPVSAPRPETPSAHLDVVFGALTDPTRRAVLRRLRCGRATMTELAGPLGTSLPALTKHLAVLEHADLIHTEKVGRHRYCALRADALRPIANWLADYTRFWNERFDNLTAHLEENP